MIRGLYTSGWSMMANERKMDVISNNLANVNTTGFKKDTVVFQSFPSVLTKRLNDTASPTNPTGEIGDMQLGSDVGQVFTYYNQGQFVNTERSLDLAIVDSDTGLATENRSVAFFTVGKLDGNGGMQQYYTKSGSFSLNANGQLVTSEGDLVLGEGGIIELAGEDFNVLDDGTVMQNGEVIDRLLIRQFADATTLEKVGNHLVRTTAATQEVEFSGSIRQGYLEQSNVNIIREMVDMITVMRSYEANQKLIQAQDATLEKAVNEVGAVR